MKTNNSGIINHCNPVRLRVTGSGNLRCTLFDLGNTLFEILSPWVMSSNTGRFATILANFESEKIQFEFRTTAINETFRISAIVPFTKPTSSSYPQ